MAGFHRFDNSIVNIFQLYLIKCFGNKCLCVAFFLKKVVMCKFFLRVKFPQSQYHGIEMMEVSSDSIISDDCLSARLLSIIYE